MSELIHESPEVPFDEPEPNEGCCPNCQTPYDTEAEREFKICVVCNWHDTIDVELPNNADTE